MSNPDIPMEVLDHIVNLLHNEMDALKSCCLASKSWIPRTRKHLFAEVKFRDTADMKAWRSTFLNPSTSPACHTKSLIIQDIEDVTAQDAEEGGYIPTFSRVKHFEVNINSPGTRLDLLPPPSGIFPTVSGGAIPYLQCSGTPTCAAWGGDFSNLGALGQGSLNSLCWRPADPLPTPTSHRRSGFLSASRNLGIQRTLALSVKIRIDQRPSRVPAKGMKTTKIARARTAWEALTPTAASAGNWRGVSWGLDGGRDGWRGGLVTLWVPPWLGETALSSGIRPALFAFRILPCTSFPFGEDFLFTATVLFKYTDISRVCYRRMYFSLLMCCPAC